MMDQLSAAEQELARKKAEADQDMMMASMVGGRLNKAPARLRALPVNEQTFVVLQASDNAKEAENNARKAKSAVKMVLSTITSLLEQLGKSGVLAAASAAPSCRVTRLVLGLSSGNIDRVDLSKLNQIDESLKNAKGKMADSDLDRKLAELNEMARSQEDMINDYDRQIQEIHADIANLNDIKNTLPDGCFNTPSLERP